jgi:hypothetical protein
MTQAVSPAYQQIVQWYQHWETIATPEPAQLLVNGGPLAEASGGTQSTDPGTPRLDVMA